MYTYAKSVRLHVCLLGMSHMNASHNKRVSAQARPEPLRLCCPQPFELNWLSRQQRKGLRSSLSPVWSQSQFRFVWDHFADGCDFCWLSRVWHMEIIKSAAKHQAQSSKKPRLPPSTTLLRGRGATVGYFTTHRHAFVTFCPFTTQETQTHTTHTLTFWQLPIHNGLKNSFSSVA